MHIFLQGPSGTGKSTILREVFLPYIKSAAGFAVQRLLEKGSTAGFKAFCLDGEFPPLNAVYDSSTEGVFILRRKWMGYDILEQIIMEAEKKEKNPEVKFILLDEIGGIELCSPVFMKILEKLLSGNKPCYGVFKSRENLIRSSLNLQFKDSCGGLLESHQHLEELIRTKGELLSVTEQNRGEIREHLEKSIHYFDPRILRINIKRHGCKT